MISSDYLLLISVAKPSKFEGFQTPMVWPLDPASPTTSGVWPNAFVNFRGILRGKKNNIEYYSYSCGLWTTTSAAFLKPRIRMNSEFRPGRWLRHCWLFTTPKKIRYMKSPTKIASGPQCQIPPSNHPWKQAASYDFGKSSSRWIDFFPLTYSSRAYQISLRHFPRPSMFPRGWRYKLCWMIGTPHHYLPQQLRHGSALGSNPPSWKSGVSHNFQAQNPCKWSLHPGNHG